LEASALPRAGGLGMSFDIGATDGRTICELPAAPIPSRGHGMLCAFRIAVMCSALFFLHAGPAEARRVALVIGDAPFASPLTDAAAVAEALQDALTPERSLGRDEGLDHFLVSLYRLLRETGYAEVGVLFGTGATVLACRRGGAVGEEASCGILYFAHWSEPP
jgi:hypothetical protein